jgi:hypothetical protein
LQLLAEKKRREQNNPARDYVPNGKAEEFIKLVGSDSKFVNMFVAANGVGKSCALVNILTNIVFGMQNKYFDYPLFKNWPYLKRGRIISDPTTIKAKLIPELEKWFPVNEVKNFPEANYEMGKEGKNYICKIKTSSGWEIDVMSTEQAAKEFESADIGFTLIDEPIPKDIFMATLARGRMGMIVIWGFTPLFFAAWIKDWMDEHTASGDADYVEADVEANCKIHGVRGILEHANIKRMADSFPEDEREARIFGKFGHLIGRVHKKFNRKIHVIKPFPIDEKRFATHKALDPHPNTADHALYVSVDKNGTKYVTGEIISVGGARTLYDRMRAFEASMHYRMEGKLIDPSAYNDDQHREQKSVGSQLFDLGESYTKGSKDLMAGIKRTNDALDYQLVNGKMIMPPELYIFDTCTVMIKQLDEYVWQEYKGAMKDDKKASSRPRDKDDHQPENLHRILLSEPTWTPMQLNQNYTVHGRTEAEVEDSLDPYRK